MYQRGIDQRWTSRSVNEQIMDECRLRRLLVETKEIEEEAGSGSGDGEGLVVAKTRRESTYSPERPTRIYTCQREYCHDERR